MNKKECFEKFIATRKVSQAEFALAKEYYNETNDKNKTRFNIVCSVIGKKILDAAINEENTKVKFLLRFYNLTIEDAEYMINKYTLEETESVIILDYWSLTKDLEGYLSKIFEECEASNWQKDKLQEIATKLHISYEMLLKIINEYQITYSEDETVTMPQTPDRTATEETKENDNNSEQNKENIAPKYQRILRSKYYTFASMLLDGSNEDDINSYVEKNNIRFHYFRSDYLRLLIEYYRTYRPIEEIHQFQEQILSAYDNYFKNRQVNPYYRFCLMLINNEPIDQLSEFAAKEKLGLIYFKKTYINQFIDIYQKKHTEEETRKIAQTLIINFNNFLAKSQEKEQIECKLTEEEIKNLKFKAIAYIHGANFQTTFGSFKANKLNNYEVVLLSQIDYSLYQLYQEKVKNSIKLESQDVNKLVSYIKNGIIEHNVTRAFDILDYYLIFNKPLECILKIVKEVSSIAERLILNFYRQNKPRLLTIKEVQSLDIEINCTRDEKGFPMPGTGIMATLEEKDNIINYLISNNIPLTLATYKVTLLRSLNGTLNIKPENEQPKM